MAEFRFSLWRVRKAGLPSTPYAKALCALWTDTKTVEDMERVFGREVVRYLERNGHIAQVNGLYALTALGVETLYACGFPPTVKTPNE